MNNKNPDFSLESKLFKLKIYWFVVLFISLLFLTLIFLPYLLQNISPKTPTSTNPVVNGTIMAGPSINGPTNTKPQSSPLITIIYIISLLLSTVLVATGRKIHSEKSIRGFFESIDILKTNKFNGIVTLDQNTELEIKWDEKKYFILKYNGEELGYAKSTELYWKILFLKQKIKQ